MKLLEDVLVELGVVRVGFLGNDELGQHASEGGEREMGE